MPAQVGNSSKHAASLTSSALRPHSNAHSQHGLICCLLYAAARSLTLARWPWQPAHQDEHCRVQTWSRYSLQSATVGKYGDGFGTWRFLVDLWVWMFSFQKCKCDVLWIYRWNCGFYIYTSHLIYFLWAIMELYSYFLSSIWYTIIGLWLRSTFLIIHKYVTD